MVPWKKVGSPELFVTSVIFKPLPKVCKQSPIGRILAQSGHPEFGGQL
jgi:hypothetical protein